MIPKRLPHKISRRSDMKPTKQKNPTQKAKQNRQTGAHSSLDAYESFFGFLLCQFVSVFGIITSLLSALGLSRFTCLNMCKQHRTPLSEHLGVGKKMPIGPCFRGTPFIDSSFLPSYFFLLLFRMGALSQNKSTSALAASFSK